MARLFLTEYERRERVRLTRDQLDALQGMDPSPSIDVRPTPGEQGVYDLTPGSMVGVVRLPDLTIEIAPKVSVQQVIFLISYALGQLHLLPTRVDVGIADLVEAMVRLFHDRVHRATHRGLLHGYETREEALHVVRGRIRIDDQLRQRFGVAVPIEVSYDEFTPDIPANQLLKAAVRRLARLPLRSRESRRLLGAMRAVFVNVSDIEYRRSDTLPDPPLNPLNAHYQPALGLARLILKSTSFELAQGKVRAASFLIDMNRVFEDFVVVALREALELTAGVFPQGAQNRRLCLDREERVRLEPDISWWENSRCTFVGDTKYKRAFGNDARNADIYQVLAYAMAARLPSALLIYAAADDADEEAGAVYRLVDGRLVEQAVLDLRGDSDQVLNRVTALAAKVREHRARASLVNRAA
ncbi:MAG: hypothetical protein OXG79_02125 [Chloroflexi bacterium]|nr:hypothetical protein [Chloroflexota bacterium]